MARLDFDQGTERDEAFQRIGGKNRVGRKHNHQVRGRAREKARQNLLKGKAIKKAQQDKRRSSFQSRVKAYWAGDLANYPKEPR